MPKGSSKSTATIQRLLEERRQYEAWIARLSATEDATPAAVRVRVKADYEARLRAVTEELKTHAESARQTIEQKKHFRGELQKKETQAAEKLAETELRHAVGEYDEAQWSQVHKDALAELVSVREELQAVDADVQKLEELEALVRAAPRGAPAAKEQSPRASRPVSEPPPAARGREALDELAFIKSVTEDEKSGTPSAKRASGIHYQPAVPVSTPGPDPTPTPPPAAPSEDAEQPHTLKCKECGAMNLPTEWYCKSCGAEMATV